MEEKEKTRETWHGGKSSGSRWGAPQREPEKEAKDKTQEQRREAWHDGKWSGAGWGAHEEDWAEGEWWSQRDWKMEEKEKTREAWHGGKSSGSRGGAPQREPEKEAKDKTQDQKATMKKKSEELMQSETKKPRKFGTWDQSNWHGGKGSGPGSQSWGSNESAVLHSREEVDASYDWYRELTEIVDNPNVQDAEDVFRALSQFASGPGVECNRMGRYSLTFRRLKAVLAAHTFGLLNISCVRISSFLIGCKRYQSL